MHSSISDNGYGSSLCTSYSFTFHITKSIFVIPKVLTNSVSIIGDKEILLSRKFDPSLDLHSRYVFYILLGLIFRKSFKIFYS